MRLNSRKRLQDQTRAKETWVNDKQCIYYLIIHIYNLLKLFFLGLVILNWCNAGWIQILVLFVSMKMLWFQEALKDTHGH